MDSQLAGVISPWGSGMFSTYLALKEVGMALLIFDTCLLGVDRFQAESLPMGAEWLPRLHPSLFASSGESPFSSNMLSQEGGASLILIGLGTHPGTSDRVQEKMEFADWFVKISPTPGPGEDREGVLHGAGLAND